MRNKKVLFITQGAVIAAIYVVLTYIVSLLGLTNGVIQVRLSEALTILPVFTPAAIPGLVVGCVISNILTGAVIWDVIFGSLATLIGAVGTYLLRKHHRILYPLPPIIANTVISDRFTSTLFHNTYLPTGIVVNCDVMLLTD